MLTALQQLNVYIEKGDPPTAICQEHTYKGKLLIRFTWKDDTSLMLKFETVMYIKVLRRFQEFWRPSFPSNILKAHVTPDKKKGESNQSESS